MTEADWFSCEDPNPKKPIFATFLQKINQNSFHAGIFYTDPDQNTWTLHVAWHYDFRREAVSNLGPWVEASLDPIDKEQLAASCERIYKRNKNGLPYGIRYVVSHFDQHGALQQGPDEKGLTCATFILAVFASVGIYLIDISSWQQTTPIRKNEDQEIQQAMIVHLQRKDPQHAEIVAQQVGCIRVRPSEAVAAGTCQPFPAAFAVVAPKGKFLERRC
jgi:hypothetical protein